LKHWGKHGQQLALAWLRQLLQTPLQPLLSAFLRPQLDALAPQLEAELVPRLARETGLAPQAICVRALVERQLATALLAEVDVLLAELSPALPAHLLALFPCAPPVPQRLLPPDVRAVLHTPPPSPPSSPCFLSGICRASLSPTSTAASILLPHPRER
jgi:hypothetical protein